MPCRQRQLQANLHPRAQRHCTQQKNVFGGKAKLWQLGLGPRGAAALEEAEEQAAFLNSENTKIHRAKQIKAGLSSHPRVCAHWLPSTGEQDGVRAASELELSLQREAAAGLPLFLLPTEGTDCVSPKEVPSRAHKHTAMCAFLWANKHM